MKRPNILFLVWDACRADYVDEYAEAFCDLAAENVRFERAVAPATWSLPSHASLFSGRAPHQHGVTADPNALTQAESLVELGDRGYTRYGVSANGYIARNAVVDDIFDEFAYTLTRMRPGGLDVSTLSRHLPNPNGLIDTIAKFGTVCTRALTQDRPVTSLLNVTRWVYNRRLFGRFSRLERYHPLLAPTRLYQYDPNWNTEHIEWFLRHHDQSSPFYLFSNYMDTHHPYTPPQSYQRSVLGEALSYRESKRINDEVGDPVEFIQRAERGSIAEDDLATLQKLYVGEVMSVDNHLSRLLDFLDNAGIRDETVVVVTADHGEILGEEDAFGRRRMGHIDVVSDVVNRVPLVVAHPDLESQRVTDWVSITSLCQLFESLASGQPPSNELVTKTMRPDAGIVVVERPADRAGERYDGYPDVPSEVARRESFSHTCIGYRDDWLYVSDSTGMSSAWKNGVDRDPSAVPTDLVDAVESRITALCTIDPLDDTKAGTHDIDDDVRSELESLGYL